MDIVASLDATHWWIEVKDCKGFEADNLPRLSPSDPEEVTVVRTWAKSQGHDRAVSIQRAKQFVVDEVAEKLEGSAQWSVVLLLTWNPAARDFGRLAMRLCDKLRQRLAAYNVQCFVLNESEPAPQQPWTLTRCAASPAVQGGEG